MSTADRLYALLPNVVRMRDAEAGEGALHDLLEILASQLDVVDGELDQLYADQFIETCAEWVVPYLGDLIGYREVHGRAPGAPTPRALVANTIAYRRRKGTAAVVEQLARDSTGWPARAVELFERIAATQYLNHPRPDAVATADLRRREAMGELTRLAGAFDDAAHTLDVRRIGAARPHGRGRYNVPNIGIFLFRTAPMPLVRSVLRALEPDDRRRFRFDPLGTDTQLFSANQVEPEITHLATTDNVPLPLTVRWFKDHLAELYGTQQGLRVEIAVEAPVPSVRAVAREDVLPSDLRDHAGGWANPPKPGKVAIDPERGRVQFGTPLEPGEVPLGTFCLGLAVPVGARTVERARATTSIDTEPLVPEVPAEPEPVTRASHGGDLQGHLDAVRTGGTLLLEDSALWDTALPVVRAERPAGQPPGVVTVVAENDARPVLATGRGVRLQVDPGATVLLDGLVVEGGPIFLDETGDDGPRTVVLRDCTLVPGGARKPDGSPRTPGAASLVVLAPGTTVLLDGCITGPVVAVEGTTLVVRGSVVDAGGPGGVAIAGRAGVDRSVSTAADRLVGDGTDEAGTVRITASTVVGGLHAVRLDADDAILWAELPEGDPRLAAVWSQRRQVGCLRFSWVPTDARVGRRFRCQPDRADPAQLQRRTRPAFTSLRFGDPAYAQLAASTPDAIRRGAEDEGEMGATHDLYAPLREDDVTTRLDEYLRYGLEAGIFHAT